MCIKQNIISDDIKSNAHIAGRMSPILSQGQRKVVKVRGTTELNSSDFLLQKLNSYGES